VTVYYVSVFLGSSGRAEIHPGWVWYFCGEPGRDCGESQASRVDIERRYHCQGSNPECAPPCQGPPPPSGTQKIPNELPGGPGPPSAQPLNRSTAQPLNGSTAPAVTTYFAHKINNITSPAPGKPAPMVYPSTRRDSQGCPTKAEGRTIAKQCWASRPNPSGQRQEPCSHGPSRPAAVGAPAGQRRVRVYMPQTPPSPFQSNPRFNQNGVTHRLQPRPATTAETRTGPACPIPSGETNARRRPNTANTQLRNKPTAPQRTQIKALTTPMPERLAKSTSARPPARMSQTRLTVGHFGTWKARSADLGFEIRGVSLL